MALHLTDVNGIELSFETIQSCLDYIQLSSFQGTVQVDSGIYHEKIYASIQHITFEGQPGTIFSYDDWAGKLNDDGTIIGTTNSTSFTLDEWSHDIHFKQITFQNSYPKSGEGKHTQAVAYKSLGDQVRYTNCRFLGKQDTLYIDEGRHHFEDCYIEGTVDFIFGGGVALFERCTVHSLVREGSPMGYITAARTNHNRETDRYPYGFVFEQCQFTSEPISTTKEEDLVYLGRPWRNAPSVVIANSFLGEHISLFGWCDMHENSHQDAFFFEYINTGPGVKKHPFRNQLTTAMYEAISFDTIFNSPSFSRKWVQS